MGGEAEEERGEVKRESEGEGKKDGKKQRVGEGEGGGKVDGKRKRGEGNCPKG